MTKINGLRQTVFVIDDEEPVRDAIATSVREAGFACATFATARQFLDAFAKWPPNSSGCLVLDIRLPGISGLDLQDRLRVATNRRLPIIFISGHSDVPMAVRAMKGGALDFLRKPFAHQELLDRIEEALSADAARHEDRRVRNELRARAEKLTPRETQVFERIARGQANKAIAIDFGISERTVEIHRSRVMRKMLARNLPDLVRMKFCLDAPPT